VDLQEALSVSAAEEVTFIQQSAEAYRYRDAVRFENGCELLLQELKCGQRVDVLRLAATDFERKEHEWLEEEYRRTFIA
jgi:hypothetical protein